jgi:cholesterol 7-dehydrogenase
MVDVSGFLKGLSYRGQTEHHINCHLQDIPSNGADTLHFKYVHTYIIPQLTSLYFKWQSRWTTGDKEDVKSFFEHEKKDIHDFKQKIWREIVEPYPNKEILSIGNLENWIHIPVFGQWYMFSATIIQVGLGIVFIILKSPLYELVFHHYIRPQGINKQAVFHDCYISPIVPLFASSKVIEL